MKRAALLLVTIALGACSSTNNLSIDPAEPQTNTPEPAELALNPQPEPTVQPVSEEVKEFERYMFNYYWNADQHVIYGGPASLGVLNTLATPNIVALTERDRADQVTALEVLGKNVAPEWFETFSWIDSVNTTDDTTTINECRERTQLRANGINTTYYSDNTITLDTSGDTPRIIAVAVNHDGRTETGGIGCHPRILQASIIDRTRTALQQPSTDPNVREWVASRQPGELTPAQTRIDVLGLDTETPGTVAVSELCELFPDNTSIATTITIDLAPEPVAQVLHIEESGRNCWSSR